eukprot:3928554-Heterocapsa_arctica.AAC.1
MPEDLVARLPRCGRCRAGSRTHADSFERDHQRGTQDHQRRGAGQDQQPARGDQARCPPAPHEAGTGLRRPRQ